jgi:hypothetical protein
VPQGRQLTFVNADNPLTVRFHTVTACRAPCNRTSGIKYPLADGRRTFDSGQLGFGPTIDAALVGDRPGGIPITPVVDLPAPASRCKDGGPGTVKLVANGCVGSRTWRTPKNLSPGLYTYYCRIHPFMRGAFRVVPDRKLKG